MYGLQVSFPSFGHGLGLGIESPWITPNNPLPVINNLDGAGDIEWKILGINEEASRLNRTEVDVRSSSLTPPPVHVGG